MILPLTKHSYGVALMYIESRKNKEKHNQIITPVV